MRVEARVEVGEEELEVEVEVAEMEVDDSKVVAVAAEETEALSGHVEESEAETVPDAVKEALSEALSDALKEEEAQAEEEVLVSHQFPCDLVLEPVSFAEAEAVSEAVADDSNLE